MGELQVVCIGAGPRTLGVLERLGALLQAEPDLLGGRRLRIDVLDPFPPGAGRVWRPDQEPLLWMNSRAADVAMLPDASSRLRGTIPGGPTLYEWLDRHRSTVAAELQAEGYPALAAEARAAGPGSFVSRALASRYLSWVWEQAVARFAPGTLRLRATTAVDVVDLPDGRQLVRGADGSEVVADTVLLAPGHPDVELSGREAGLARAAAEHGLDYVAPAYTSDADLSALRAGEDVVVLGMGLAFVDLLVLVGQGRGGRFSSGDDGRLRYEPSGAEPVLHVGTRRGVPYRSKISYEADVEVRLRWYSPAAVQALAAELDRPLDLREDVWPLVARELALAHYGELFRSHPERTTTSWAEFDEAFGTTPWNSSALHELVRRSVPDPADRFDLPSFDRPLAGFWSPDPAEVDRRVRAHVEADVARRAEPRHSADLAVFVALLQAYGVTAVLVHSGALTARSALDVDGWWHNFFSYTASGPPPERLRQLLALAEAGVVRFLGAGTTVRLDGEENRWVATSASSPVRVASRVLVDARLPQPGIATTTDPVLRALHGRGEAVEQQFTDEHGGRETVSTGRLLVDAERRLIRADGSAHPRRFAVGPWVAGLGWAAAFARPRLDAGFFRLNEQLALALLTATPAPAGPLTFPPAQGTRGIPVG